MVDQMFDPDGFLEEIVFATVDAVVDVGGGILTWWWGFTTSDGWHGCSSVENEACGNGAAKSAASADVAGEEQSKNLFNCI